MKTNAELMEENAWFIELIREGGECWMWDDGVEKVVLMAEGFHICEGEFVYYGNGCEMPYADSIKTERRYLGKVEQMQWLVDHGYRIKDDYKSWTNGKDNAFLSWMWRRCGEPVDEYECFYHPEWIKEVEV